MKKSERQDDLDFRRCRWLERGGSWSGSLAAPTLADIDGDGELEAVIQTVDAGAVAFDLPGTRWARTLWPTGRGSFRRAGVAYNERIFGSGFGG